jgi:hypothetical protein
VRGPMSASVCSWCGTRVAADEGYRATEPEGSRRAAFCRLEHIVPWVLQGAHWEPGTHLVPGDADDALGRCVQCGDRLGPRRVLLVRHRGEHRIGDAFCGVDHLLAWAKAGGRWAR